MIWMWHAGLGGPMNLTHRLTGRIMVIGTVGRKSGEMRRTPLNYSPCGDSILVLASFGERTGWLKNLQAHPFAEVWLPDGSWLARAEEIQDPRERLDVIHRVLKDSGFAAKVFAGIDPRRVDRETLRRQTENYRAVRLRLLEPLPEPEEMKVGRAARTGLGIGLGLSLAWAWFSRKE
jgi:deazaflavin-dependent oxidoreductase (nitroreductase family)